MKNAKDCHLKILVFLNKCIYCIIASDMKEKKMGKNCEYVPIQCSSNIARNIYFPLVYILFFYKSLAIIYSEIEH